jgi:hypothetical protein
VRRALLLAALATLGCRTRLSDGNVPGTTIDDGGIVISGDLSTANGWSRVTTTLPLGCGVVSSILVADFDRDGKLDVVVACRDVDVVMLLRGNGDGSFANAPPVTVLDESADAYVAGADFDGDGRPDLVDGSWEGARVVENRNVAGGWMGSNLFDYPSGLAAADLDGDGRPDLVMPRANDTHIDISITAADGTPGALRALATDGGPYVSAAAADFDGDGKADVALGADSDAVTLFPGDGMGALKATQPVVVDIPGGATRTRVIGSNDFDGDGTADIVVATDNAVFYIPDHGGLAARQIVSASGLVAAAAGDVDGDGRSDVVIADGRGLFVVEQEANGNFAAATPVSFDVLGPLAIGDADGDGRNDVIAAGNGFIDVFLRRP